eukprot:3893890-Amphidinium_carterae.5
MGLDATCVLASLVCSVISAGGFESSRWLCLTLRKLLRCLPRSSSIPVVLCHVTGSPAQSGSTYAAKEAFE